METKKTDQETFYADIQAQQRIVIPRAIYEVLKLKQGQRLRIIIEKV